jgi:tRNA threonylcarbamoyladenosine biosynthesis protein TsaB
MTPALLAFDTSTERMSVALLTRAELPQPDMPAPQWPAAGVAEASAPWACWLADAAGGALASTHLLPEAARLLAQAELGWADLTGIGFGQGPGAFTGLRTACSVAQGLAFGRGIPVWPLDTLAAVLEDASLGLPEPPTEGSRGWALQDARMGEVYAALYERLKGRWQRIAGPWVAPPEGLQGRVEADLGCVAEAARTVDWVAGSALANAGLVGRLSVATDARHRCPAAWPNPRALAAVMGDAFAASAGLAAAQARPLYLRDKVAFTTAERRQAAEPAAGDGSPTVARSAAFVMSAALATPASAPCGEPDR